MATQCCSTARLGAGPQRSALAAHKSSAFVSNGFRSAVAGRAAAAAAARGGATRSAGQQPLAEANLFSRIARIFKSYANAAVSAAEDPEKLLDQAVADMQTDLIRLRQSAAQVTASRQRLQLRYDQSQSTAADWYRRAELALAKGDEELAKEALMRRKANADDAAMLKTQLEQQSRAVDTIVGNMRVLEGKLSEAKMKKDTLKARAQSAKSVRAINDMVAGMDTSSALGAFERMEEKVMTLEAQAEAAQMLVAPDSLESQFRALEGGAVDDDLADLKAALQLGSGSSSSKQPVGELPPGRPLADALEYELQDLKRKQQQSD